MIAIGKAAGVRVTALLTQMDEPLGAAIGNSLEVIESVEVLRGGGPADIRELTLMLSAEMLLSVGRTATLDEARALLVKNLDSGAAYEKWCQLVTAHGGDVAAIHDLSRMPQAAHVTEITAPRSGVVTALACERIGRAAVVLGAAAPRPKTASTWRSASTGAPPSAPSSARAMSSPSSTGTTRPAATPASPCYAQPSPTETPR